jgi:hypothetical protein
MPPTTSPRTGGTEKDSAACFAADGVFDIGGMSRLEGFDSQSSPISVKMSGQYQDRLVRTGEGWRFVERRFTPDAPAS